MEVIPLVAGQRSVTEREWLESPENLCDNLGQRSLAYLASPPHTYLWAPILSPWLERGPAISYAKNPCVIRINHTLRTFGPSLCGDIGQSVGPTTFFNYLF